MRLLRWFRNLFRLCEMCWAHREFTICGVQLEPSYTMYHWDGKGKDPNRPVWLCRRCEPEHKEFWKDMWSNVPGYGG